MVDALMYLFCFFLLFGLLLGLDFCCFFGFIVFGCLVFECYLVVVVVCLCAI